MESQPQNPEFRINPENFQPCILGSLLFVEGSINTVHLISVQKIVSYQQTVQTPMRCHIPSGFTMLSVHTVFSFPIKKCLKSKPIKNQTNLWKCKISLPS